MRDLKLIDIELGHTDAKHELLSGEEREKNQYVERFLIPDNIILEDYLNRKKFYIVGLKGTGKTALLRYLDIKVKENNIHNETSFILFKSDFTDDERDKFGAAANGFVVNKNVDENKNFDKYLKVWEWFFHRQVVRQTIEEGKCIFENDEAWGNYVACLTAIKERDKRSMFHNLIPRVKRGNVELTYEFQGVGAKLGLELSWNQDSTQIEFSRLLDEAKYWFSRLTPLREKKLYIFIDELEIALTVAKQYKRDIQLVRDLILTVSALNQSCAKLSYPVFIIAAVREEVLTAVESSGHEINKQISDFGMSLRWHQSGGNIKNHPLIKMINLRIQSSEKSKGFIVSSAEEIWEKYFPKEINSMSAMKYIIGRTWHRPRDIVRLLRLAQKHYPHESMFTHQAFDSIAKDYSTESWTEMSEELSTIYSQKEIKGIKFLLIGFESPFSFDDFVISISNKRKIYDEVEELISNHKPAKILHTLYDIGIIGNTGDRVRFAHRGDDSLLLDLPMKIIDPLWQYLNIRNRRKN